MDAPTTFVLFTLGPVQSFIKAARTVRDLWSGSYLLSYLTFRAMKAVADKCGAEAIVFPNYADLPLTKWYAKREREGLLEPCIPNRFLAEVPATEARACAETAEQACRDAWHEIAEAVRGKLRTKLPDDTLAEGSTLWDQQIVSFFEVYTAACPAGGDWCGAHQHAQRVLAAKKARRPFPQYEPYPDPLPPNFKVPQKDTLLGTFEHVGPGDFGEASRFWANAAKDAKFPGGRVSRRERLCAVSLVKRFAWTLVFADRFGCDTSALRFPDTATIAAERWLSHGTEPDPRAALRNSDPSWSGLWLHWPTQDPPKDDEDEDRVPDHVWTAILKKREERRAAAPSYYAALVFDGDRMGERFNVLGRADYTALSAAVSDFYLHEVRDLVEGAGGTLVYAGGDDAIALLPTETALDCAHALSAKFKEQVGAAIRSLSVPLSEDLCEPSISGGLVVAHYKEDLRFVLEQAHEAETAAKRAGRGRLALSVCRRSGEHSTAVVTWDFVPTVSRWVGAFRGDALDRGASDRWAYKLRAELPVLEEQPDAFKLELRRRLNRAEDGTKRLFAPDAVAAEYVALAQFGGAPSNFLTLVQSASFLARGRDA
jgi:CRISPR-associated protein Cmr2